MTNVTTAADIGSAIAQARKARGLSQTKLAAAARTTQAMVSEIERGKDTARIAIVLQLIAALGLAVEVRDPQSDATVAAQQTPRSANVVIDEPLPDDSIDLDAIVGDKLGPKTGPKR